MADYGITQTMHGYNPNSVGIGNSNGPRARTPYFVLHTQQAKSTAVNLAKFCNNSAGGSNPVAYNLAVDGRDTIVIVPLNEGPWAAADANNIGIHACFAGSFAEWTRGQWLDAVDDSGDGLSEDAAITRMAKALAAAHLEYNIPLVYAGDGGRSGWPVKASGVVGHMDFGARGGGHTDPGREFIDGVMSTLLKRALTFVTPEPKINLIEVAAKVATSWIGKRATAAGEAGEQILRAKNGKEIGRFVAYENAHVYWRTGERAAFVVPHGGLFEAWADLGWESGPLGFPVRDFTKLEDGAVQAFQGGVLYRKDGKDGFYVTGVIGARYLKEGAERGDLGYPTSNEYDNGTGGRRQDFENGALDWDPSGAVSIERRTRAPTPVGGPDVYAQPHPPGRHRCRPRREDPQGRQVMFTKQFWRDTTERAVKTAAQSLGGALAGYAATGFSWTGALIAGGVAAALSVLTSLASSGVGNPETASLVSEPGGRHRRDE